MDNKEQFYEMKFNIYLNITYLGFGCYPCQTDEYFWIYYRRHKMISSAINGL